MTREEAKEMFRKDKNAYGAFKAVLTKVDLIFDHFEKELQTKKCRCGENGETQQA